MLMIMTLGSRNFTFLLSALNYYPGIGLLEALANTLNVSKRLFQRRRRNTENKNSQSATKDHQLG